MIDVEKLIKEAHLQPLYFDIEVLHGHRTFGGRAKKHPHMGDVCTPYIQMPYTRVELELGLPDSRLVGVDCMSGMGCDEDHDRAIRRAVKHALNRVRIHDPDRHWHSFFECVCPEALHET